ncbi:type II toxin-antitoxin system RelE/ParE family toxin [Salinisphaera orenii]|uniref:type II toxin-antitoxin system RelE/ParE family toxin n=1 Tax=Salinisphaera orenii TaxID=856731 RepID=UPI0013A5F8D5
MTVRLTRQAEDDLITLYIDGATRFGSVQADQYYDRLSQAIRLAGEQPYMARQRDEIEPPVRGHPCGAHILIYQEVCIGFEPWPRRHAEPAI